MKQCKKHDWYLSMGPRWVCRRCSKITDTNPNTYAHVLSEKDMDAINKHGEEQTKRLINQLRGGKFIIYFDVP